MELTYAKFSGVASVNGAFAGTVYVADVAGDRRLRYRNKPIPRAAVSLLQSRLASASLSFGPNGR